MIVERKIVLKNDDIFRALRQYIGDNVMGVMASEVCDFKVHFEDLKPIITVTLEDKDV